MSRRPARPTSSPGSKSRAGALLLALLMVAGLTAAVAPSASALSDEELLAQAEQRRPKPAAEKRIPVQDLAADAAEQAARQAQATQAALGVADGAPQGGKRSAPVTPVTWPLAAEATVTSAPASPAADLTDVGGLAVGLSQDGVGTARAAAAVSSAEVTVHDQDVSRALGLTGVVLSVAPVSSAAKTAAAAAPVPSTITVDYSSVVPTAAAGDLAHRLRLVALPACALTTPAEAECRRVTPLPTTNDTETGVLTAAVLSATGSSARSAGGGATVLAMAAGASGDSGDFGATSLAPSSSWSAGAGTGEFSWSYPLPAPPTAGGPGPELALSYSSASVDGRTISTNNQTSWVGEGFDLGNGFIERRYTPCGEDVTGSNTTTKTGDLCWGPTSVSMSFGSRSGDLVKDDATGRWVVQSDDATKVELLTGGFNGDDDKEYWKVTTTDGFQYFFGRGRRSSTDTTALNSAWTVPVYGNHAGEPCYAASFASSWCQQAWRWNLDYVVDPDGNTMTYVYDVETNRYGRNLAQASTSYVRSGYLNRIEYNQRAGSEASNPAAARVVFTTAERCLPTTGITCAPAELTAANAKHWPDTPFDQICTSTTSCGTNVSPTFFTRKRLTAVTTQVRDGGTYRDVDQWTLEQSFPASGDTTSPSLWLASIGQTGKAAAGTDTDITLPRTVFQGVQKANRVDGLDNAPPLMKWRVQTVVGDSGSTTAVIYSGPDCTDTDKPASPQTNTRRCFPVYWAPPLQDEPSLHYFHKYVVSSVTQYDNTGLGAPVVTSYTYGGTPAWHYDESVLTPDKQRTYGQWRGYGTVDTRVGATAATSTKSRTLYLRGMDTDPLPGGARRDVVVTDSRGGTFRDHPRLAGVVREQITYLGDTTTEVSSVLTTPTVSAARATMTTGGRTLTAHMVNTGTVRNRTALKASPRQAAGERVTETTTTYDTYGRTATVWDKGDLAVATDDICTAHTYADNATAWLLTSVSRTESVSTACGATTTRPAQLISDQRFYYDGSSTLGAAPSRGNLTKTEVYDRWDAATSAPVYATLTQLTYDAHGRPTSGTDALGRTTRTSYTPATGAPVTGTTTTDAAGLATTDVLDPARGKTLSRTDPNGRVSTVAYDALGRATSLWLPNRDAAAETPSTKFSYTISTTAPNTVRIETLQFNGTYTTGYELFDGLLRPRQTQSQASGGGRLITSNLYDAHGWVTSVLGPFPSTGAPAGTLVGTSAASVPRSEARTYDLAGRVTSAVLASYGATKATTTTTYGGNWTAVVPPTGGTTTTTYVDARGNTSALDQHTTSAITSASDRTTYTYTPAGQLASHTDPLGNRWTSTYDARARVVSQTDPDRGTSTTTYDAADQVVTTTDARGSTLHTTYDSLGRRTALRQGSATGTLLATWTYDTATDGKGQLATSTRYAGGNAYTQSIAGYSPLYAPTGTTTVIPASEGALAGTYTRAMNYNATGQLLNPTLPEVPGLGRESLSYEYDELGLTGAMGGSGSYVPGVVRTAYGEVAQLALGNTIGKLSWNTFTFEDGTRRPAGMRLDRQGVTTTDMQLSYAYDAVGNLARLSDTKAPSGGDTQCFQYDYLRRMTTAWAQTTTCAAAPSVAVLGGPAKYWHSYAYDKIGNRTSEVINGVTTGAAATTRTYTAPASGAGAVRPHSLTKVVQSGAAGARTDTYTYDATGNTTSRVVPGKSQTLTWDVEGRMATAADAAGTTSYLYDAGGERLIRREPGAVTLFLGDDTEVRLPTGGAAASSTRYYSFEGRTVATRSGSGFGDVQYLISDHHGTASFAVAATTGALTSRRMLPFGGARGTTSPAAAIFPGGRGFVDGVLDASTGLTQLGARAYDSTTGRFVSVDPIADIADPQQLHGYAYASNNPTSMTDPDGLLVYTGYDGMDSSQMTDQYGIQDQSKMGFTGQRQIDRSSIGKKNTGKGKAFRPQSSLPQVPAEPKPKFDLKQELIDFGLDMIGFTDAKNCVTKGDVGACVGTLLQFIPWGKVFKLGKAIYKLADKFLAFTKRLRAWEDKAEELAAAERRVLDDVDVPGCNCFVAGTAVQTEDGPVPIEDVEVGDRVWAKDIETGRSQLRTVVGLFDKRTDLLMTLTVDGERVQVTTEHPFYVNGEGWVMSGDLREGDQLVRRDGGVAVITAISRDVRAATVYNFEVDGLHNYYITDAQLLVHNCPMATRPGAIARAMGYTTKQIRDAIHAVKGGGGWRGNGRHRNPDMFVDTDTGDVFPPLPDGSPAEDSIGNVLDHLERYE